MLDILYYGTVRRRSGQKGATYLEVLRGSERAGQEQRASFTGVDTDSGGMLEIIWTISRLHVLSTSATNVGMLVEACTTR